MNASRSATVVAVVIASAGIAAPASGRQSTNLPAVPGTRLPGLRLPTIIDRPLDQGISDRDELATSLRQMPANLGEDRGFESLWALPGNPDYLYRRDGGLTAVFPASEYAQTENGTMVLIPAGTVFYIGQPSTQQAPPPASVIAPTAPAHSSRPSATRIEPEPAPDRLEELPGAEKVTAQIAATPERRVITPKLAAEAVDAFPPEDDENHIAEPNRSDEHTMSNEAYRRLRLHTLTIRLADAE